MCTSRIAVPSGGYLFFRGHLRDEEVTIASYYALNTDQLPFFKHLLQVVSHYGGGVLLLCGDSNLTLKPHLD